LLSLGEVADDNDATITEPISSSAAGHRSVITTKTPHSQELLHAAYRAAVDLPRSTMNYVADLIRREMP
jgi:hypothetical protein